MPPVILSKLSHSAIFLAQACLLAICILGFTFLVSPSNLATLYPTVKPTLYQQEPELTLQPQVRADLIDDSSTETAPSSAKANTAHAELDDTFVQQQWSLQNNSAIEGASGLFGTHEYLTSADEVVVAVIDSGVMLEHADLYFLPGYDFIHEPTVGNDGDGRDHDPSDPETGFIKMI